MRLLLCLSLFFTSVLYASEDEKVDLDGLLKEKKKVLKDNRELIKKNIANILGVEGEISDEVIKDKISELEKEIDVFNVDIKANDYKISKFEGSISDFKIDKGFIENRLATAGFWYRLTSNDKEKINNLEEELINAKKKKGKIEGIKAREIKEIDKIRIKIKNVNVLCGLLELYDKKIDSINKVLDKIKVAKSKSRKAKTDSKGNMFALVDALSSEIITLTNASLDGVVLKHEIKNEKLVKIQLKIEKMGGVNSIIEDQFKRLNKEVKKLSKRVELLDSDKLKRNVLKEFKKIYGDGSSCFEKAKTLFEYIAKAIIALKVSSQVIASEEVSSAESRLSAGRDATLAVLGTVNHVSDGLPILSSLAYAVSAAGTAKIRLNQLDENKELYYKTDNAVHKLYMSYLAAEKIMSLFNLTLLCGVNFKPIELAHFMANTWRKVEFLNAKEFNRDYVASAESYKEYVNFIGEKFEEKLTNASLFKKVFKYKLYRQVKTLLQKNKSH